MSDRVLSARFRTATVGVFALGFLIAFEALAVTAAMPLAARDLHGTELFALTFSAFAAASVVGTVVSGAWSDRSGPVVPLLTGVAVFAVGLVASGTAPTMALLIVGRVAQGVGTGTIGTALYVLVARVYPERLHPRVFALLAAAWVLPSLVGPFAAGAVATYLGWQWVFLGILPLVVLATALLVPTLRGGPVAGTGAPLPRGRIAWSVAAAVALLLMRPAIEVPVAGPALAALAAIAAVVALRPLLPRGTFTAARGLPAVITGRALFGAGFAIADAYLPFSLIELRGLPAVLAGGIVTIGAVSWATGSELQSRLAGRLADRDCVRIGSCSLLAGLTGVAAVTATAAPLPLLTVAWLCAGLGIGFAYPRFSTATLSLSREDERGRNSGALQIADGFGGGVALTAVAVAAAVVSGADVPVAFGLAMAVALAAVVAAPRTGPALTR